MGLNFGVMNMSFTVSLKTEARTVYPRFGIYKDTGISDIDVVYTLNSVLLNADNSAMAVFSVGVSEGSQQGEFQFWFTYSGSGDPREEAESALKSSFV
ncbi:TPA: hypothetical protein RKV49_003280 [Raoultella ornithinolytica]|nr:hypothetical protein [Raoultella ornithinolytica]